MNSPLGLSILVGVVILGFAFPPFGAVLLVGALIAGIVGGAFGVRRLREHMANRLEDERWYASLDRESPSQTPVRAAQAWDPIAVAQSLQSRVHPDIALGLEVARHVLAANNPPAEISAREAANLFVWRIARSNYSGS